MTRSIDHLTADHEQMTRKIINLQTLQQYIFYGSRETLTQATSSSARKAIHGDSVELLRDLPTPYRDQLACGFPY
jgi:hypothetical protein